MEHQKPSVLSPAGHDPHMGQVGIEGQIAGGASAQSTGAHRARWARTPLPTAAKAAGSPAALTAHQDTKPEQSSPKGRLSPLVLLPGAVTTAGTPQRASHPTASDLPPQK